MNSFSIAEKYIGLKEVAGDVDNPRILEMLKYVDKTVVHDETPWCSAFVNWVAHLSGALQSKSLMARSWLKVGQSIDLSQAIQANDICILSRDNDPSLGHVGFYYTHTSTKIKLLGGNQGDAVSIKEYDIARLLGVRRIKELNLEDDGTLDNEDTVKESPIQIGDKNIKVLQLQMKLKQQGFFEGIVDGIFGKITKQSVINFQKSKGLVEDGEVGINTLRRLNSQLEDVSEAWIEKALSMISYFETSSKNPWIAVTGDFDQMGVSCGVLQWNIGQKSLQPFIIALGKGLVLSSMPTYGERFWMACNSSIAEGLQIVRLEMLNGEELKPTAFRELQNLLATTASKSFQMNRVREKAKNAKRFASKWALDSRNSGECTIEEYCWFYDLLTLNGGLDGVTAVEVKNYLENFQDINSCFESIYNWATNYPDTVIDKGQKVKTLWKKDVPRNIAIWREQPKNAIAVNLFVLAYLRALKSRNQFKLLTLIRKAAICLNKGYVNGNVIDFNNF